MPVLFEFSGEFYIVTPSLSAAEHYAQQHCELTLGNVHSTLPPDQVEWIFSCHPIKKVGKGSPCEELKLTKDNSKKQIPATQTAVPTMTVGQPFFSDLMGQERQETWPSAKKEEETG